MLNLLAVALGGAVGAGARYALTGWAARRWADGGFPAGTLLVNVLGCLLIGLLVPFFLEERALRPEMKALILIGLLGGFTTFSTYAWEAVALIQDGQWGWAGLVFLLNNALGLGLVLVGYRLATWIQRAF